MTWLETLAYVLEAIAPVATFIGLVLWGIVQLIGIFAVIFLYTEDARDPEPPSLWIRWLAPFIWAAGTLALVTTMIFASEFLGLTS